MKETAVKSCLAIALAGLGAYFNIILVPLAILIFLMVCDYATGMTQAWITKTVSSRLGIVGIVKKSFVTDWKD